MFIQLSGFVRFKLKLGEVKIKKYMNVKKYKTVVFNKNVSFNIYLLLQCLSYFFQTFTF